MGIEDWEPIPGAQTRVTQTQPGDLVSCRDAGIHGVTFVVAVNRHGNELCKMVCIQTPNVFNDGGALMWHHTRSVGLLTRVK